MARFAMKTLEFALVKELLAAKTATALGKRAALALAVENDFLKVEQLQEETAAALRLLDAGLRFPFGGASDIGDCVKRAAIGALLNCDELLRVGLSAAALRRMQEFLMLNAELAPALSQYAHGLQQFPRLEKQIEGAIDEHGELKDSASPKLRGLRTAIFSTQARVRQKLEAILRDPALQKYFQDNLVTMRAERYVIPIKQEYKFNFPGLVHDQSSTGATLFVEPLEVLNLNNEIKRYQAEEKEEVERILRQLSQNVGAEAQALLNSLQIFTYIDLLSAKALLAAEEKAVRPQLTRDASLEISQGRHPLLSAEKVVPIDVSLGEKFKTLVITGPNTGGKTVALKAVGLFALMAQAGLFLPAKNAKLPVFQAVYADIGDEQSIEQSLSTFSAHIEKLIAISAQVRSGDLVLLDELCAGTDPNEGAALAMALLEFFHAQGALVLATTHYSELKTFAFRHDGMENASVEFDVESLRPTYRLLLGVPGSSNAFHIARRLGLAEALVARAAQLLDSEHAELADVLEELDSERRKYESGSREIAALRLESEELRNQLAASRADFERRKAELLRKARAEADEIYRRSRREAESVLKELRSLYTDAASQRLVAAAQAARGKLDKTLSVAEPPPGEVLTLEAAESGQQVYLLALEKEGVLLEARGLEATVEVGSLKISVPLEQCLLVKKPTAPTALPAAKENSVRQLIFKKIASARQEVDLRGLTLAEALPVVDKAIDDAFLAGASQLRLLHGKGTGALRSGLAAYLEKNRYVRRMESAGLDAGGSGVTVIYL